MAKLSHLLPFLHWTRPDAALLRGEALAGLTVGLMVIPQGVAYASLAGMPLVTGIYASMLPALVAVLFGASQRLSVGPTALSCLLVSASLAAFAQPGTAEWVSLAVWLALLSGLLQVALGLARFGWLLNLVNAPVLMAFSQAAALLIIGSQAANLLGWSGWSDEASAWRSALHAPSLAFGLGSLALLMAARRWRPAFPSVLLVVLASAGLSQWLGFADRGGQVVGDLPSGMPALYWPEWPGFPVLTQLAVPVLVITLVSFLETAASAKVDNARQGTPWNQDQDLIGQGLAKVASGLCGAFPTSSSFSRSALNLYAGARTGWATIASVAVVAMTLQWLLPVLQQVPQAVLAAVVVVAVLGMIKPLEFKRLWTISRAEAVTALATFAITLLAAPQLYWGVLAGVLMSLSHFLYKRLHPRIIEVGLHADGRLRDRHLWELPPLAPQTYALRMDAALDFGSSAALERAISDYLNHNPNTRRVVILAQAINSIDATGVEMFARLRAQLALQDRELWLVGAKLPVETVLKRAELLSSAAGLRWVHGDPELLGALALLDSRPSAAADPTNR
jgi:SulP family sulfate permease